MIERDRGEPSPREPFPIESVRKEKKEKLLEEGWQLLLGKGGLIPQGEKYTPWRQALKRLALETLESGWYDHHPSNEPPFYLCHHGSKPNYLIHPDFTNFAKQIRKKSSLPKTGEKRAPQESKRKNFNLDEVAHKVEELLSRSGQPREEAEIRQILFGEEMEIGGVEGLKRLLTNHGFALAKTISHQEASDLVLTTMTEEDPSAGLEPVDSLDLYCKENQTPPLPRETEILLTAWLWSFKNLSPEAKPELYYHLQPKAAAAKIWFIQANTRLVIFVAKKYQGHSVPFLDLIQEGNLGLIHAIEKFDFRRGHQFSTYATWWIRKAIARALPSQGGNIRIPIGVGIQVRQLIKTTQQLEQVKGRKPTDEELAQVLNISPQQLEKIQAASTRTITRLETPLGEDKDSELANFIPDQSSPLPEKVVVHDLVTERLEEVLATLDPREERILRLRFGLNGEQRPYTLEEVGEMLGLTRERVRQIQNEALRHLRHPRRARLLKDFYDGR